MRVCVYVCRWACHIRPNEGVPDQNGLFQGQFAHSHNCWRPVRVRVVLVFFLYITVNNNNIHALRDSSSFFSLFLSLCSFLPFALLLLHPPTHICKHRYTFSLLSTFTLFFSLTATIMSTPADVVKTRMMNQYMSSQSERLYKNSLDCFIKTAKAGVIQRERRRERRETERVR